jgi:hypothetical protein
MTKEYEKVLDAAKIGVARSSSKPLKVAFCTLLLKYTPSISLLIIVTLFYSSGKTIQIMRLFSLIPSSKPSKIQRQTQKPSSAVSSPSAQH